MKAFKQFRLLHGATAIRIKAGMTQQVLAQFLGVSKSLISMVENGRRNLPFHAYQKLSKLEAAFEKMLQTNENRQERIKSIRSAPEPALRKGRMRSLRMQELIYIKARTEERRAHLYTSLRFLDSLQASGQYNEDTGVRLALKLQRMRVWGKLERGELWGKR